MRNWSTLKKLIWQRGALAGGAGYAWTTVSGSAPLSLPDAVEKRLKTLIQEGRTAQGISPTMTSPQNLICNNGTLQLVDSELPSGYKRLASIKFDGDFWYDTGEQLHGSDDVTLTLTDTSTTGQNVFGSYNGTSAGTKNFSLYLYGGGSSSKCYLRYGDQLVRPQYGSGERTLTFGASGTDGFTVNVTVTPDTFTTEASAYIGMLPNSSSPAYTGTIVGNILVGTRLKYVPCERVSDGVVGYYEMVEGGFIAPSGTGTPTKGDYDYSVSHIGVVGTAQGLSLGTRTASVVSLFSGARTGYPDLQDVVSGEVTRNVGIKVFDGTEDFTVGSGTVYYAGLANANASNGDMFSTHFTPLSSGSTPVSGKHMTFDSGRVVFYASKTADEFKAWLAEQYAAGTPVILLYPLAAPVTEQVPAQALMTAEGSNTVALTKVLAFQVNLTATYAKAVSEG